MGKKIELDENYIINEYLKGKSSLMLSEELKVSKPVILKILNKFDVIKKRDRCQSLDFKLEGDRYIVMRKCPKCGLDIKTSSNSPIIACRNYFNLVKKKSLCKKCSLILQKGEGNPFYGKKHTKKTKDKISKQRTGKGVGSKNTMSNPKWRKKAGENLKKKWDSGELEHVRKIMSDKLKETRRLGKLKSVIRSKKEKELVIEIKNLGYDVKHSFKIDTKIIDIYIPKLNLIIEYNGDYWHCNPSKYHSDYYHQKKKMTAKEIWEYDKNKIDLIKNKGYIIEVIWESDLKQDHNTIKNIIKKYEK